MIVVLERSCGTVQIHRQLVICPVVEQLPVANLAPDGFLERNVFLLVFHSHCNFLLVGIWDIALRLQIQNMLL